MAKSIILIFCVLFFACKSTKEVAKTVDIEVVSEEVKKDNYGLVVSFFSRGPGIDHEVKEAYDTFISKYESDNNLKIEYEAVKWGREGEIDMCFNLDVLSKKKKEEFVTGSKEILSKSDRVYVYEDFPCRRKS